MNDASWGAAPSTGHRRAADRGSAPGYRREVPPPAGPLHEAGAAAQTRPMPIVPDAGGDQDDRERGAAHVGGPLFRDEQEPDIRPQQPDAPEAPKAKKSAGRDLRAAIGVGVGLGAVILASLFIYKPVFLGVIVLAVVVGLWELTSRLAERKDIKAPLVPLA
ncbi:phosphatidate cytidylyltransferase, partial [Streptomyces sp. NRRL B-1568]